LTVTFDKSSKIQLLSQAALISIFTFILVSFVIPQITANHEDITQNTNDIKNVQVELAKINMEKVDDKLRMIDEKLDKIVLGMCGEFGGKYCE